MAHYFSSNKFSEYSDQALLHVIHEKEVLVGECVQAKRARDTAFAELYERLSHDILRYCVKVMGNTDTGREAMQETFVKLFSVLTDSSVEIDHIKSYCLRIARNQCLNMKRVTPHKHVTVEDVLETMQCYSETPAQQTEREHTQMLLNLAVEQLNDDEREILTLRVYDECSYQEIADIVQQPISTITNRLHRAKDRLRRMLKPILVDGT